VVATGERIGPWANLQSYLMVAELTGCTELNVALPELVLELDSTSFAVLKRRLVTEMARITAALHKAHVFHKDLYLCHFYLDRERLRLDPSDVRLALIDLHRLGEHRFWPDWWRWKDLGQLLFSALDVPGIEARDILRFWVHYRLLVNLRWPLWQARVIKLKAARYQGHNRSTS
jgi:heptose I phosphotransferase